MTQPSRGGTAKTEARASACAVSQATQLLIAWQRLGGSLRSGLGMQMAMCSRLLVWCYTTARNEAVQDK
jgi:hypothetical protein